MRRYGRKTAELAVTVRAAGNKVEGGIRLDSADVSEGGAFLRSSLLFEIGELLHLEIPLPTGAIIKTNGKVVRVAKSRGKDVVPGMGIEFLNLSPQDRKALASSLPAMEARSSAKVAAGSKKT